MTLTSEPVIRHKQLNVLYYIYISLRDQDKYKRKDYSRRETDLWFMHNVNINDKYLTPPRNISLLLVVGM